MNSFPFQVLTRLMVSNPMARQTSILPEATDSQADWKQSPPDVTKGPRWGGAKTLDYQANQREAWSKAAFSMGQSTWTRTAAKREASVVLVPSRQVTCRQARFGNACANCLAETGLCVGSRRISEGGRPCLRQRFGGNGAVPGGQTLVEDWMPTT